MNSKLYVGNLAPSIGEADLETLFSKAGSVETIQVVCDPTTRQSRGYAFVTMATPELAAAALSSFHSYQMAGRHITVTEARPPQEPKGLMSEGFDFGTPTPFRPAAPRSKHRHRAPRFARSRGR